MNCEFHGTLSSTLHRIYRIDLQLFYLLRFLHYHLPNLKTHLSVRQLPFVRPLLDHRCCVCFSYFPIFLYPICLLLTFFFPPFSFVRIESCNYFFANRKVIIYKYFYCALVCLYFFEVL